MLRKLLFLSYHHGVKEHLLFVIKLFPLLPCYNNTDVERLYIYFYGLDSILVKT